MHCRISTIHKDTCPGTPLSNVNWFCLFGKSFKPKGNGYPEDNAWSLSYYQSAEYTGLHTLFKDICFFHDLGTGKSPSNRQSLLRGVPFASPEIHQLTAQGGKALIFGFFRINTYPRMILGRHPSPCPKSQTTPLSEWNPMPNSAQKACIGTLLAHVVSQLWVQILKTKIK